MAYQPVENYGIIGNMHTTALVGLNGSIDWFCFPSHDSPSVFGAVLDDQQGGRFRIAPVAGESGQNGKLTPKQLYWPGTNILITRFLTPDGVGEIVDFMPVGLTVDEIGFRSLIRQVRVVRGV
ncbi:MAG TPA: trehalase-like domain-containing protein, partial [Allocoleopsis sp.]